ncbi:MAG: hypothetical protein R3F61_31515 [Myxococcota bacterium]
MRRACLGAVLAGVLACTGFMEDVRHSGADAAVRMGGIAGTPLPSGVANAEVVETTSPDWLLNGEATLPRSEADAWFAGLVLPCDQPTVLDPVQTEPPLFQVLKQPHGWRSPHAVPWQTRSCEGSTYSGPHFSVSITTVGDPAWVWVHGMTL